MISTWMGLVVMAMTSTQGAVEFDRPFAPIGGLLSEQEKELRSEMCLNGRWGFQPVAVPQNTAGIPALPEPGTVWETIKIKIPSPWNVNSFAACPMGGDYRFFPSYPKAWEAARMGWLQRTFPVPADWAGDRRVFLHFEGVAGECEVRINGQFVGRHFDSFSAFRLDVTDHIKVGENELLVGVRDQEFFDKQGPYGKHTYPAGSFWGQHMIGIWQDVYLLALPEVELSDLFIKPLVSEGKLQVTGTVINRSDKLVEVRLSGSVFPWIPSGETDVLKAPENRGKAGKKMVLALPRGVAVELRPGQQKEVVCETKVTDQFKFWSPDAPNLYGVVADLSTGDGVLDRRYDRFGWREFKIDGDRFLLNGEPIRLKIELCHFMGIPHMTPRWAWAYYNMAKDANVNAIRLHAQPHPRFFMDLADEMGMLIHSETAVWGSDLQMNLEEPDTWARLDSHLATLVRRDRNHPSIFGWSPENETYVAMYHQRATDEDKQAAAKRFAEQIELVRKLDPTREWVSFDGCWDLRGLAPVSVHHYELPKPDRRELQRGIPWGISEETGTYFSMPPAVSAQNGEHAYENFIGRMEGVAYDVFANLKRQLASNASMVAIYDITWYGLKPLPFGQADTSRPFTEKDGVFFTAPYREGVPGVQPERLGPYSSVLNPGFDPTLPMYAPWPHWEAVRDVYAADEGVNSRWSKLPPRDVFAEPQTLRYGNVLMPVKQGMLADALGLAGLALDSDQPTEFKGTFVVIDVDALAEGNVASAVAFCNQALKSGADVMLWASKPESAEKLSKLSGRPFELKLHERVSMLRNKKHTVTAPFSNADLYFVGRGSDAPIVRTVLTGDGMKGGTELLRAAELDWRQWLRNPEPCKTTAPIRSEREAGDDHTVLAEFKADAGALYVCTMDVSKKTPARLDMLRKLFRCFGVQVKESPHIESDLTSEGGFLKKALVISGFQAASLQEAFDQDFLGGEAAADPKVGDRVGELEWKVQEADITDIFNFEHWSPQGVQDNSAAYLSVRVFSPRSDVLLLDPRGAKLSLRCGSDDGIRIWLNGREVYKDATLQPLNSDKVQLNELSLKKGWNHLLIKVVNSVGPWQFKGAVFSPDPSLQKDLKLEVEVP